MIKTVRLFGIIAFVTLLGLQVSNAQSSENPVRNTTLDTIPVSQIGAEQNRLAAEKQLATDQARREAAAEQKRIEKAEQEAKKAEQKAAKERAS